jgi:predicted aspartyl protease
MRCGFDDQQGVTGQALLTGNGPTVYVGIGFDPTYDPNAVPLQPPQLPSDVFPALIDTGASECCIDSGLAMRLNLPIIDRRSVSGVHGAGFVNVHLAHIHVAALGYTMYGPFCAVELVAGGQAHQALLGRTFLNNVTMTYEGRTGTVILEV